VTIAHAETRPRVLLVQGDAELRMLLAVVLGGAGFEVETGDDIAAANAAVARDHFELVIVDFWTGGGIDACWSALEALRAAVAPAPIGILSGWRIDPDDAARRGFAFVLRKPVSYERLLEAVGSQVRTHDVDRTVIEAYFAAIERSDWPALGALCTADVVYHLPGDHARFSRTIRGRAAFEEFAAETFRDFHEPRFVIEAITAVPDGAIARYQAHWRTGSGDQASVEGAVLFGLDGNAIREIGVRTDVALIDAQS